MTVPNFDEPSVAPTDTEPFRVISESAALSQQGRAADEIDAASALEWGLVDQIM